MICNLKVLEDKLLIYIPFLFYFIYTVFDCFDVRLYEEVVRMPAVESKVIALVGKRTAIPIILCVSYLLTTTTLWGLSHDFELSNKNYINICNHFGTIVQHTINLTLFIFSRKGI